MKRILCYGDSNTWGYIAGLGERYDENTRWTKILQRELGYHYVIIEEGLCGRAAIYDDEIEHIPSGLATFHPILLSHQPLDLVILMLGSNDLKMRYALTPIEIAEGMRRYLDILQLAYRSKGISPKVLLVSPPEMTDAYRRDLIDNRAFGPDAVSRSKELSKAYENVANDEEISFFDAATVTRASEDDGLHIDAASHERLGSALAVEVLKILS